MEGVYDVNNSKEERHKKSQRYILEISTIIFFLAKNASVPLSQQYIYHVVSQKYNLSQSSVESTLKELSIWASSDNSSVTSHENIDTMADVTFGHPHKMFQSLKNYEKIKTINEESSLIILHLTIAELIPTAIMVIVFGFYSDFTKRRKFMMYLPCLGTSVYFLGFILSTKVGENIDSTETRVFMILASIASGLSGSFSGYLSGNSSYISDTDTRDRRTSRLALVELFIGVTFGFSSLFNGMFITTFNNFEQLFWIVFSISLMGFFLILLFLDEPGNTSIVLDNQPIRRALKKHFFFSDMFGLKSSVKKKIWLIFVGYMIFVFVQQGQERTFVPFLKGAPLFWDSFKIGTFLFIVYTSAGLGAWPGVILLKKCCGDVVICVISLLSKIFGSVFLALSTNSGEAYGAGLIQPFHLVPYAVVRSIISQEISPLNQGSIYAFLHSSQAVVGFLGPLCHNSFYTLTMDKMGGLTFLLSGCLLIVSVVLFTWTYFLDQNEDGYADLGGTNGKISDKDSSPSESTTFISLQNSSE